MLNMDFLIIHFEKQLEKLYSSEINGSGLFWASLYIAYELRTHHIVYFNIAHFKSVQNYNFQ